MAVRLRSVHLLVPTRRRPAIRTVPDRPIGPWQPPAYEVGGDGKIVGATPGNRHNWGRWGEDDQRGTANLLGPDAVAAAAGLIRTGKRFSLGLPLGGDTPGIGNRPAPRHLFPRPMSDAIVGDTLEGLESADDVLILDLQASTQLDGFGHFGDRSALYNGYWAGLVTGRSGARRLGIHHQADGVVGRGVLLDVARVCGIDPFESAIDAAMLEETASAHGVEVGAGDVLLVRTGWLETWWSDPASRRRRRSSGLAPSVVDWVADRDLAMVAADNRTVEVIPGPEDAPLLSFHRSALVDLGLLVGELFDLEELATDCAADGVHEFFFVATPLPVVGGVGSPLNPLAIK